MVDLDLDHDLDPVDPIQMDILGRLLPEERVLASMAISEMVLAGLRGALHERYPDWSQRRLNLEALGMLTPLRGARIREFIEHEFDFVLR